MSNLYTKLQIIIWAFNNHFGIIEKGDTLTLKRENVHIDFRHIEQGIYEFECEYKVNIKPFLLSRLNAN